VTTKGYRKDTESSNLITSYPSPEPSPAQPSPALPCPALRATFLTLRLLVHKQSKYPPPPPPPVLRGEPNIPPLPNKQAAQHSIATRKTAPAPAPNRTLSHRGERGREGGGRGGRRIQPASDPAAWPVGCCCCCACMTDCPRDHAARALAGLDLLAAGFCMG
jgi:hypothetical protein